MPICKDSKCEKTKCLLHKIDNDLFAIYGAINTTNADLIVLHNDLLAVATNTGATATNTSTNLT